MNDLKKQQTILDQEINEFLTETNVQDDDEKKRSLNYLNWLTTKTQLVRQERSFTIPTNIDEKIKRGTVVWVEFGFNLGHEFGGRHPALILRRTGGSVFVLPLSSQQPSEIKSYHVKIPRVYEFTKIERWTNVLKVQNISVLRIDIAGTIGNVKGWVLDDINKAMNQCNPYNNTTNTTHNE